MPFDIQDEHIKKLKDKKTQEQATTNVRSELQMLIDEKPFNRKYFSEQLDTLMAKLTQGVFTPYVPQFLVITKIYQGATTPTLKINILKWAKTHFEKNPRLFEDYANELTRLLKEVEFFQFMTDVLWDGNEEVTLHPYLVHLYSLRQGYRYLKLDLWQHCWRKFDSLTQTQLKQSQALTHFLLDTYVELHEVIYQSLPAPFEVKKKLLDLISEARIHGDQKQTDEKCSGQVAAKRMPFVKGIIEFMSSYSGRSNVQSSLLITIDEIADIITVPILTDILNGLTDSCKFWSEMIALFPSTKSNYAVYFNAIRQNKYANVSARVMAALAFYHVDVFKLFFMLPVHENLTDKKCNYYCSLLVVEYFNRGLVFKELMQLGPTEKIALWNFICSNDFDACYAKKIPIDLRDEFIVSFFAAGNLSELSEKALIWLFKREGDIPVVKTRFQNDAALCARAINAMGVTVSKDLLAQQVAMQADLKATQASLNEKDKELTKRLALEAELGQTKTQLEIALKELEMMREKITSLEKRKLTFSEVHSPRCSLFFPPSFDAGRPDQKSDTKPQAVGNADAEVDAPEKWREMHALVSLEFSS